MEATFVKLKDISSHFVSYSTILLQLDNIKCKIPAMKNKILMKKLLKIKILVSRYLTLLRWHRLSKKNKLHTFFDSDFNMFHFDLAVNGLKRLINMSYKCGLYMNEINLKYPHEITPKNIYPSIRNAATMLLLQNPLETNFFSIKMEPTLLTLYQKNYMCTLLYRKGEFRLKMFKIKSFIDNDLAINFFSKKAMHIVENSVNLLYDLSQLFELAYSISLFFYVIKQSRYYQNKYFFEVWKYDEKIRIMFKDDFHPHEMFILYHNKNGVFLTSGRPMKKPYDQNSAPMLLTFHIMDPSQLDSVFSLISQYQLFNKLSQIHDDISRKIRSENIPQTSCELKHKHLLIKVLGNPIVKVYLTFSGKVKWSVFDGFSISNTNNIDYDHITRSLYILGCLDFLNTNLYGTFTSLKQNINISSFINTTKVSIILAKYHRIHLYEIGYKQYIEISDVTGKQVPFYEQAFLTFSKSSDVKKNLLECSSAAKFCIILPELARHLSSENIIFSMNSDSLDFILDPFDYINFRLTKPFYWILTFFKPSKLNVNMPILEIHGRNLSMRFIDSLIELSKKVCSFYRALFQAQVLCLIHSKFLEFQQIGMLSFRVVSKVIRKKSFSMSLDGLEVVHSSDKLGILYFGKWSSCTLNCPYYYYIANIFNNTVRDQTLFNIMPFLSSNYFVLEFLSERFSSKEWIFIRSYKSRIQYAIFQKTLTLCFIIRGLNSVEVVLPGFGKSYDLFKPPLLLKYYQYFKQNPYCSFSFPLKIISDLKTYIENFNYDILMLESLGFQCNFTNITKMNQILEFTSNKWPLHLSPIAKVSKEGVEILYTDSDINTFINNFKTRENKRYGNFLVNKLKNTENGLIKCFIRAFNQTNNINWTNSYKTLKYNLRNNNVTIDIDIKGNIYNVELYSNSTVLFNQNLMEDSLFNQTIVTM